MNNDKYISTFDFVIRWLDMDSYKHVTQTCYFEAMSETRAHWLGHSLNDDALQDCLYYAVESSCAFYKSFKYPGVMRIQQFITAVGRSSFNLRYDFYSPEDDQLYARGTTRIVCIDPKTERPRRIPEAVLNEISS